jgi:hypothetical protein
VVNRFAVQDFLQQALHPAASVQHFAQVAGSLQQSPAQAAAGLQHALSFLQQVEQPVVISKATAQAAASNIMFFMVVFLLVLRG